MTAGFVRPPAHGALLDRLQRHEKLLGLVVDGQRIPATAAADLDFVVVAAARAAAPPGARSGGALPVVLLVESEPELATARGSGRPITMARTADVAGADIHLSDDGVARMVTSPAAARAAFASGADLVVYDAIAMLDQVLDTLPSGRPSAHPRPDREPLVLLSGMLGDHHVWDDVAAALGSVARPWPVRIDLDDSVAEMALSVLADAPPRFALAGHSLGAIVALEIMRREPERVSRLALINASARGAVAAQLDAWARWRRRTESGEFDEVAAELARATLPEAHRRPELLARNEDMARAVGPDGFLRQLAAQATRPDSRDSVAAIAVPVLVVSGELDEVCPPALQRELVDLCPRARLETVADAGHMTPMEQPERVGELLMEWLADDVSALAVR